MSFIDEYIKATEAVIRPLKLMLSNKTTLEYVLKRPFEAKQDLERCNKTLRECASDKLRKLIESNPRAIELTDELCELCAQYKKILLGYDPAN